jgi:hypothetical protein
LADDTIQSATEFAYSDGDRLSGCLDLIHAPAPSVWIEWLESTRQESLRNIPHLNVEGASSAKRGGVLVQSDRSGRVGTMRTFWSMPDEVAYTGCITTSFDLNRPIRESADIAAMFDGAPAGVTYSEEPAIDEILDHVVYRFDAAWISYYRAARLSATERTAVMNTALGSAVYDTPMVLALFLLMTAKDGLHLRTSDLTKINRVRQRTRRGPLLEHIEAHMNLASTPEAPLHTSGDAVRRPSRMHHVRGHLARRGNKVFWRSSHLRGSARQGLVRTRTVSLSFH